METIARKRASVNASCRLHAINSRLLMLRGRMATDAESAIGNSAEWLTPLKSIAQSGEQPCSTESQPLPTHVTLFGTLAAAILRHDGGTVGRVWLVLRAHFAGEGQCGMISAETILPTLTNAFPQYSQRHLRDLLKRGENLYWERDHLGRLWLTGAGKVAERLNVKRLQGVRVVVPLADLTGKLSKMRTALQAAFHAGRNSSSPISRATLRDLTGISERSQREQARENTGLIQVKENFSLDGRVGAVSAENHAYQHGQNSFTFKDSQGLQGAQGSTYHAHQLPNTYTACYSTASQGRKRKINRQLTAIRVMQRARGTGWQQVVRRFYHDGATAAKAIFTHLEHHNETQSRFYLSNTQNRSNIWQTF